MIFLFDGAEIPLADAPNAASPPFRTPGEFAPYTGGLAARADIVARVTEHFSDFDIGVVEAVPQSGTDDQVVFVIVTQTEPNGNILGVTVACEVGLPANATVGLVYASVAGDPGAIAAAASKGAATRLGLEPWTPRRISWRAGTRIPIARSRMCASRSAPRTAGRP